MILNYMNGERSKTMNIFQSKDYYQIRESWFQWINVDKDKDK